MKISKRKPIFYETDVGQEYVKNIFYGVLKMIFIQKKFRYISTGAVIGERFIETIFKLSKKPGSEKETLHGQLAYHPSSK